jgi:hypothetical protein
MFVSLFASPTTLTHKLNSPRNFVTISLAFLQVGHSSQVASGKGIGEVNSEPHFLHLTFIFDDSPYFHSRPIDGLERVFIIGSRGLLCIVYCFIVYKILDMQV